jgi:hypothetical protein
MGVLKFALEAWSVGFRIGGKMVEKNGRLTNQEGSCVSIQGVVSVSILYLN